MLISALSFISSSYFITICGVLDILALKTVLAGSSSISSPVALFSIGSLLSWSRRAQSTRGSNLPNMRSIIFVRGLYLCYDLLELLIPVVPSFIMSSFRCEEEAWQLLSSIAFSSSSSPCFMNRARPLVLFSLWEAMLDQPMFLSLFIMFCRVRCPSPAAPVFYSLFI